MALVTSQNIQDLGFVPEQFKGQSAVTFDDFLTSAISDQSDLLKGEIGAAVYASTDPSIAPYVKRAERCLVEAELWRRRIATKSGRETGGGHEVTMVSERQAMTIAADEALSLISKLGGGDCMSGFNESSHFDA
jgi:hypothetical protein